MGRAVSCLGHDRQAASYRRKPRSFGVGPTRSGVSFVYLVGTTESARRPYVRALCRRMRERESPRHLSGLVRASMERRVQRRAYGRGVQ